MHRRFPVVAVFLFAIACSGGEQKAAGSGAIDTAPDPHVVRLTARDFSFDAPDTVPAGVTRFELRIEGTNIHHAQLIKFNEGKTLADYVEGMKAMKPGDHPPTWAVEMGGPNPPAPGEMANTTEMLEPGNYAVVCFVDIPDKVPHIMKGMAHAFVVVPSAASAGEPSPDVTVKLVDYTFSLSTPLTAGQHTIRVENGATQPHEIFVAQLLPGKTMDDFGKWGADYKGPPPVKPMGGIAAIQPGAHATFTVNLPPGDYALICFVPDAKDGKPHMMHGMVQQFKVG